MKRFCLFAFALLLVSSANLKAQEKTFFFGGNAGLNLATYFLTEDYADFYTVRKPAAGITVGFTSGVTFGKMGIQSGIHFIQKGTKAETENLRFDNGAIGYQKTREKSNFISIPLLFRYQFFDKKVGFSMAAGPTFNFALSGSHKTSQHTTDGRSAYSSGSLSFGNGVRQVYKRFQPALCLSPGVTFKAGTAGKFGANLAFDIGFNALNQRRVETTNTNGNISNMGMAIVFSYVHHMAFGKK